MENKTLERMLSSDIKMNRNRQFSLANQKWKMKYKNENHALNWNESSYWPSLLNQKLKMKPKQENDAMVFKWIK